MTYLLIMDAKSRCEADRSAVYIRTFLKTVLGFLLSGPKDPTLRAERRLFFFSILHRDYVIGCSPLLSFDI